MRDNGELDGKVAALGGLPRNDLVELWIKNHGCAPPKGLGRGLLERSAAWHIQAGHKGGLSAAARAVLRDGRRNKERAASAHGAVEPARGRGGATTKPTEESNSGAIPQRGVREPGAAPPLPSGTRLMREWNGRMHVVDVTEKGVLFDGKLFRSLTAVAKRITGTHRSGPRFFGL